MIFSFFKEETKGQKTFSSENSEGSCSTGASIKSDLFTQEDF